MSTARVFETTVTWRHRDTGDESSCRYYMATSDDWLDLAATHTAALSPEAAAAIVEYERACEDGVAELSESPIRRKVE